MMSSNAIFPNPLTCQTFVGPPEWGQMLYVGDPTEWMAREPRHDYSYEDLDEYFAGLEAVVHLPSFLLNPDFTGDTYFPHGGFYKGVPWPPSVSHSGVFARSALEVRRVAPPPPNHKQGQLSSSLEKTTAASAGSSALAPPWPHYNKPESGSPPSRDSFVVVPDARHRFPHVPTPKDTAAYRELFSDELRKLRALEADIDAEQRIRDDASAAASRVVVPPASTQPSSGASSTPSSTSSDSLWLAAFNTLRADSPFRPIPSLPSRFPAWFPFPGMANPSKRTILASERNHRC
ncbi:hypothetical protein B0H11DRAFT_2309490 [Mycena galericulata]|nr:hypothetical protein B0H11DRAFT_2309490 [Mycena galericulata]